jgi:hypothetical protein
MTRLSAPIFPFSDSPSLPVIDSHVRLDLPEGSYTLTGPGARAEAGHLPVRGDLAHIKLAGRYFVPHYAVPMPHEVLSETALRRSAKPDADQLCALPLGATFDVLDIAGAWVWGQLGDDGPVGYVLLADLRPL